MNYTINILKIDFKFNPNNIALKSIAIIYIETKSKGVRTILSVLLVYFEFIKFIFDNTKDCLQF